MALKKKALASIFSMNTRGFENSPFFLNSTLRCGEILLVFFVVSQRRERERERRFDLCRVIVLTTDSFFIRRVFSLFIGGWHRRSCPYSSREREMEGGGGGSGQEESVSTCGEIIIAYVTPYRNT